MYDNYSMIIRPNVESADVLIEAPSKDQFEEELESYLRFFIISILRQLKTELSCFPLWWIIKYDYFPWLKVSLKKSNFYLKLGKIGKR